MTESTQGVLFDLDGTLIDTAPDMVAALNAVLAEENQPPVALSDARDHVSHGSAALVKLGFGAEQGQTDYQRRIERFLSNYRQQLSTDSRLFDGMEPLLQHLESLGIRWGVVTNKPAWLTDPLMEELRLSRRASCIISGDSVAERKPHPLPMLTAANIAGIDPRHTLYLGDASRDIEAGNAANMLTLVANWGYIDETQTPDSWGAKGFLDHPMDCLDWITTAR